MIIYRALFIILAFIYPLSAIAETITIGKTHINVPKPDGFYLVTPNMETLYRFSQQFQDPINDQLGFYISEKDLPKAINNQMPELDNYFEIKIFKKIRNNALTKKHFVALKKTVKDGNDKIIKSLEKEIESVFSQTNKNLSKEFDLDIAMKVTGFVPLDVHYETDDTMSYSMYIKIDGNADGEKLSHTVVATVVFLHVKDKVLFLYAYAPIDQLEWTRRAAKGWSKKISLSN